MGKPSAPPPPDYTGAAQAQGAANLEAARAQNTAARANQYTPFGSQVWTQPDPTNQDKWSSTITLAPEQQALLDSQNRISQSLANTGERNLNRVAEAQVNPFRMDQMPALEGSPQNQPLQTSLGNIGDMRDKSYNELMSRQNTQFDQQDKALQQQLANQGITPGSEAWNRAYQPLNQARVDASNQSDLAANALQNQYFNQNLQQGQFANSALAQQFAQALQGRQFGNEARQQAIQEQSYLRQLPLNELNALRTGSQVTSPTFSNYSAANVTPAPLFGAAQAQGQAAQQAYQNQLAGYNNGMSGLFGLGAAALGAPAGGFLSGLFK